MTPEQLKQICPAVKNPDDWAYLFSDVLEAYGLNTLQRKAMFLAQCLHESGCLKYTKEIWGPTKWQVKYEGHTGLGNTQPGDGKKYLGRGIIQLTGRANYAKFAEWVKMPEIMDNPSLIEQPGVALLSAIWFWETNNLNKYADAGDIEGCTKRVNGPKMLGLDERKHYYEKALGVLEQ